MKKALSISVAAALLASLLTLCGCSVMNYDTYDERKGYSVLTGTVSAEDINVIEINWVSGDIKIETSDTNKVTFTESVLSEKKADAFNDAAKNKELSESLRMRYKTENGKLTVQFCKSGLRVRSGAVKDLYKRLTVYVPAGTNLKTAEINTVSADISIKGLAIDTLRLNGVSARLDVSECALSRLKCDTVSGMINLYSSEKTDEITVNSVSGDVILNVPEIVKFEADCVSADVTLTLEKADFSLKFDGLSSALAADGASYEKTDNNTYKFGEGTGTARIESVSGKVSVKVK